MTTLEIQRRLAALGFDAGPLDGVPGARTRRAVQAFQASRGLAVDGIVGARTERALGAPAVGAAPLPAPPRKEEGSPLPWMDAAVALLGVREGPGERDNPVILDWAENLELAYPADAVAWCGLFVAHCIASTLPGEALPSNPLGARNYLSLGRACPPQRGAVLVFWRGSRSGWLGHVGFYAGERGDAFKVLGGNQGNSVSYAWLARARLLDARWPASAPFLATGMLTAAGGGALSHNEA